MTTALELIALTDSVGGFSEGCTNATKVEEAFEALLSSYKIDDVVVEVTKSGNDWIVEFTDDEGGSEVIVFGVDEDGSTYALLDTDDDTDEESGKVLDLDLLGPVIAEDGSLDLTDLSWLTKSTLLAIITPDGTDEKFKTVIRGGKRVKIEVPIRKKKLTAKQKAAFRKRKGKKRKLTAAGKASLKKSLKLRKSIK